MRALLTTLVSIRARQLHLPEESPPLLAVHQHQSDRIVVKTAHRDNSGRIEEKRQNTSRAWASGRASCIGLRKRVHPAMPTTDQHPERLRRAEISGVIQVDFQNVPESGSVAVRISPNRRAGFQNPKPARVFLKHGEAKSSMSDAADRNHPAVRNLVRDGTRGRGTAAICLLLRN